MSTEQFQMYECTAEDCHMIVEILRPCTACDTSPVMCGKEMALLEEKTADAATEKHVPVVERIEGGWKVTVGSVPHPMDVDHWIQWIEIYCAKQNLVQRKFLKPGDAPEAIFMLDCDCPVVAREHCNKHGLWKS